MSFRAYAEYREAEVEWLPRLPAHWRSASLRWLSHRFSGGTPDKNTQEYWTEGSIPWLNSGAVNQTLITEPSTFISESGFANSSAKWIPEGSLVMALAGQGKTKGMVAQLAIQSTCNQSMAAIVPTGEVQSRFLLWWLQSNYQNIRNMAGGDMRDGLNLDLLGDIPCPLPPASEQSVIAAFLDHETAKIDALVEEQRRLIELLKEKRQAVISQAVTKGMNPNVPMKDSGVEWLGKVPAHWDAVALKRISPIQTVGIVVNPSIYVASEGLPFLYGGDIREGRVDLVECRRISTEDSERNAKTKLQAGDLVTVRVGAPGVTAVVPQEAEGGNCASVMLIRRGDFDSRWLCYTMNDRVVRFQVEVVQYGAAQEQFNISHAVEFVLPRPSRDEQTRIADHLDNVTAKLDQLVAEAQSAVRLLGERRSALISAAVTGKIDVRGLVPQPEAVAA